MLKLLACVAGLMGAETPPPPVVFTMPPADILKISGTRFRHEAVTAAGSPPMVFVPPDVRRSLLAHELAHVVQLHQGRKASTPRSEAEAEWVQRKADVWCK